MQFAGKPGILILVGLMAAGCASDDPDPIIAYVNPNTGSGAGGEMVTVATQGFDDDFQVRPPEILFGATPALSVTAISRSIVEVETPPSAVEQTVDVIARSTGKKQTAALVGGYSYAFSPIILSVTPSSGSEAGGDTVEIETLDFVDDFQVDVPLVWFGSGPAHLVTPSGPDRISVVTPPGTPQSRVDVTVRSTGRRQTAVLPDGFLYTTAPPPTGTVRMYGEVVPLLTDSVIYVLDRAGSMAWTSGPWIDRFGNPGSGSRWDRAMDETLQSISGLDDTKLFNIYTFACNRNSFAPAMVPATAPNKADAEAFLLGIIPYGGTGTGMAVAQALGETSNRTLFLATDGHPNCGAVGTAGHMGQIRAANVQSAQIHTIGIADSGVFTDFLREIAQETGGVYVHVQ